MTPEEATKVKIAPAAEGIERCKDAVEKHGKPEDRRALKKGLALLDEVLEVGKFQKH